MEDISFLLFGDSEDHTADYSLKDIARNANRWYATASTKIRQADWRWKWDDNNATDLPIADIDLVAGQEDYGVSASNYSKIERIDILDPQGNGIHLTRYSPEDVPGIALSEFEKTPGTPRFYRFQANSVFLRAIPSYSKTAGMRVFYQRGVSYFVYTDTTKVPGFAEEFHRILSVGAALDYAQIHGMDDKVVIFNKLLGTKNARGEYIDGMFFDLHEFYSSRNQEKISMRVRKDEYGQTALGHGTTFSGGRNPNGFNMP